MRRLNPGQVAKGLKAVPQWRLRGVEIRRLFEFSGFPDAVAFVNRVARMAEKNDHHPDIDIRWNKVTLAFSTHSKGGLTENDFTCAGQVDALYLRLLGSKNA